MVRLALILFCFSSVPHLSLAAISISEIAWMGDSDSANHEWIELYNSDSSPVDITDWELTDGMNLKIVLTGTVPGNSYVLLERNRSNEAYIKSPPFLVYTGALVNTGATLTLRRGNGSIEDQVAGGENWQTVGGDNVTKQTAQYTSQGWVTAISTPGRATTATVQDPDPEETDDENEEIPATEPKKSPPSTPSETVRLELPEVTLAVDIDMQSVAYVNQVVSMKATAKDIGRSLLPSVQYEWNFGDMGTSSGAEVTHRYLYPGTYVVTVYGYYKRQVHLTRHEITILPVTMSITRNESGDIQVHNNSAYDVDVSGYVVVGATEAVFPPRSIVRARSTITIPWEKVVRYPEQTISLYDNQAKVLIHSPATYDVSTAAAAVVKDSPAPSALLGQYTVSPTSGIESKSPLFQFAGAEKEKIAEPEVSMVSSTITPVAVIVGETTSTTLSQDRQLSAKSETKSGPVIVFILLLISAIGVVYLTHKPALPEESN